MTDCFSSPGLISVDDAIARMLDAVTPVAGTETIALRQAAGRVLSEDVVSPIKVPGYDNSAMDGYALRAGDVDAPGAALPVSQRIAAGDPGAALQPGTAARIFTGAPVPQGADAVVMQEQCEQQGDRVVINTAVKAGMNVRRAGEDIDENAAVLGAGVRIRPQEAGLLASVGRAKLDVYRKLRVAVFFTGDELTEPGEPLQPGCIYNSNQYTLVTMLEQLGCEVESYGIVEDTLDATVDVLRRASASADLVITSGGVSVGEEDYVRLALEQLGELSMWRVAMKPGKPVAFGNIGSTVFIGLPGNPVSVFVTGIVFAAPVIRRMQGVRECLASPVKMQAGFDWKGGKRQEFLRVRQVQTGQGSELELYPHQGSGVLSSACWATGLAVSYIDAEIRHGDYVDYIPFATG